MGHKEITRREFIGRTTAGAFSIGLGIPLLKMSPVTQEQRVNIVYRTLGRTKLRIPIVSFGVMNSDSPDLLRKALDMGITHFDTAHGYLRGNSERVIGEVMQETGSRDKVYIGTKIFLSRDSRKLVYLPEANEENFNNMLNISLQRLRTDYLDILYLHRADSVEMVNYEPTMRILEKAKESGKARFIGISFHGNEPDIIRAATDAGIYDVLLTRYNFMQEHKEELKKAIQYAAERGVGVVAMKTQCGSRVNQRMEIDHRAALKWALSDENVCTAIPGMTTFDQMDLNFQVMSDLALSEAEKKSLQLASLQRGPFYCRDCRTCIASCPRDVEIPTLMRAYMYAEGYRNHIQARMTVAELPDHCGLKVCQNCASCSATCRYGININERVKMLIADGFYRC